LPSFFATLSAALKAERNLGLGDEVDAAEYEHRFENNTIAWKARYELDLEKKMGDL
jgi:hypothetical protein